MRQGNNQRRNRGRGNQGRRPNSRSQTFDSNGPEGRVRGNAQQVYEKYLNLARDAVSAGDRVLAESFYQFAEHYFRVMNDSTDPNNRPRREEREGQDGQEARGQDDDRQDDDGSGDDGDDERSGPGARRVATAMTTMAARRIVIATRTTMATTVTMKASRLRPKKSQSVSAGPARSPHLTTAAMSPRARARKTKVFNA